MSLLVLLAAGAADLPSFPCGPTVTPVEAAICGDPELAAYDRAMARAYHPTSPNARAAQRAWLLTRDRCRGSKWIKGCLRQAHVVRLLSKGGLFGTSEKPESALVPLFRRAPDQGPGGLALLDVGAGKLVYHLWASYWNYARDPEHPSEISGEQFGVMGMINGVGHENAGEVCDFTLRKRGNGWAVEGADACLGANNNPNGTYLPLHRRR